MSGAPAAQRNGCGVCDTLPPGDLIELDLLMGDASRWPKTVWGIFDPPKGGLTPAHQRFGAMAMGEQFLAEKGYTGITKGQLRRHLRYDVVVIAQNADDLVARGIIVAGDGRKSVGMIPAPSALDPRAYLTYFDKGIKLGIRGLELMEERVNAAIARNEEIPMSTLKQIADLGAKLSITQASIKARGSRMDDEGDEEEGFRAGSAPLPSPRMGHHRVRVIEGEARPVVDEGPADREHYSERARQEGGAGLPHR